MSNSGTQTKQSHNVSILMLHIHTLSWKSPHCLKLVTLAVILPKGEKQYKKCFVFWAFNPSGLVTNGATSCHF